MKITQLGGELSYRDIYIVYIGKTLKNLLQNLKAKSLDILPYESDGV